MKVLYIAHYYPPCGGAGVQRTAKFIKYLPSFGIQPVVLTGSTNVDARWSPEDRTLFVDIPKSVKEYRVSEVPTNVFNRARINALVFKGRKAIATEKPDLILVTLSPFSDAQVAARLSAESGIPWIADLRDPWALDEFQVYKTFVHRRFRMKRMKDALSSASGIIMNTPIAKSVLLDNYPEFINKPVTAITNGFDSEDFRSRKVRVRSPKFRIVHTGSFHTHAGFHQHSHPITYRLLGRVMPDVEILPRSPYYLLKSLEALRLNAPEVLADIEVVFVGSMSESDTALVSSSPISPHISMPGYVSHARSTEYINSADLLFLPLHSRGHGERSSIVPGKTYEYIASGNPILGALPDGDARDFLAESGNAYLTKPDDVDAMGEGILHFFNKWRDGTISYSRNALDIGRFERKCLAGELARFIRRSLIGPALEDDQLISYK